MKHYLQSRFVLPLLTAGLLMGLSACNKSADTSTPGAPTTIGAKIDDSVITTKVKAALLADEMIKGMDIKTETHKGEVVLSGFVDSLAQIDRSTAVTMTIPGVTKVDNKLSLKAGTQSTGNKVDDSVTASVKTAMLEDATVKSMDVSVVTVKGEVQLSGFVDNEKQSIRATEIAKGVSGVKTVINNLKMKR